MKSKLLSLTLVLSLLLSGCGKKEESGNQSATGIKDSSISKSLPLQNPNRPFSLKYKFEKGKKYKYSLTTDQSENVQLQRPDTTVQNNVIQKITYFIDFSVDGIDKNNTAELTCNFTSVKLDADANGNKFKYESGKTKTAEERKTFSQYEAIINNPFSLRISQFGEIIELFRYEQIIEKFIDITETRDSMNAKRKEDLRLSLTEATLKPLLSQIFRKFPEKQVAKDSTWSVEQEPIPLPPQTIKNTTYFKITSMQKQNMDTLAAIDGEMRTEITGNQTLNNRGLQYFFDKPRASGSGKIYFNVSQGRIQSSRTSTSMVNSVTVQANSPQGLMKQTQRKSSESSIIVEAL